MSLVLQPLYDALPARDRRRVTEKTEKIRGLVRRSATDLREIGRQLIQVKELLGHGLFGEWLVREFGWDERTAQRFMTVAVRFEGIKSDKLSLFAPSALTLLAAPSTPDGAVEEALADADAGQPVGCSRAQELIEQHTAATEALSGLSADQQEEIREGASRSRSGSRDSGPRSGRLQKLDAMERHAAAWRKLASGEPDIPDRALDLIDQALDVCRQAIT